MKAAKAMTRAMENSILTEVNESGCYLTYEEVV
jgi:hypothetical protein